MNTNTNSTTTHCTQCPNHCPIDQLKCNRGRREGHDSYEGHGRHEGHGNYEGRGRHEGHGHGEHGMHHASSYDPDSVQGLMRQCGHMLFHGSRPSGQHNILSLLSEKEQMSQKELLELLNIQNGSLSELITKLERKGFLTRTKSSEDKRVVIVTITEEGRLAASKASLNTTDEDPFAVLTLDEQEQLKILLKKILHRE